MDLIGAVHDGVVVVTCRALADAATDAEVDRAWTDARSRMGLVLFWLATADPAINTVLADGGTVLELPIGAWPAAQRELAAAGIHVTVVSDLDGTMPP